MNKSVMVVLLFFDSIRRRALDIALVDLLEHLIIFITNALALLCQCFNLVCILLLLLQKGSQSFL
jgi:hypothetical protein